MVGPALLDTANLGGDVVDEYNDDAANPETKLDVELLLGTGSSFSITRLRDVATDETEGYGRDRQ